jgi:hypothetical protein
MKRMIFRAAAAAGSLALVGGAIAAGAAPAGAAAFGNGAYGAATGGTIFTPPVANATPGNSPLVASNANVPGVLTTGVILDRSDPNGSSSHVSQGVVVNVPGYGTIKASGVDTWCRIINSGNNVIGGTTITAGAITFFNRSTNSTFSMTLPMHPAANDVITLPNGEGTVTLNVQNDTSGEYGFAGIYAQLAGGQNVVVAVSACFINES